MPSVLVGAVMVLGLSVAEPPPLTQEQITKIQELVRKTQKEDDRLKAALDERQRELMEAYSHFKLDEKAVTRLHGEIIDIQRQLLGNYQNLQVGLRETIGEERFRKLKRRIDLVLDKEKSSKKDKR